MLRTRTEVWEPHQGTLPVAADDPVFVDSSGRRLLWLRLALCGVALASVVFVLALVLSVTAGGVSPSVSASSPTTTTSA
ncbi:hypothetical protein FHX82_002906 [Amycolatopsis bartoniae]|uniref:Uncharacterized protein n=1 Tax=Amycolatopsis bartoniae TaxID=941986 RepID=A0A8H9MDG1_9PSEU|nr:hypothetical protein [Amycolatopsis bartoniae]MBB2935852.1 hypothetical protein [Amycolatopsis bartoniae]TVT04990.1 hypothetical protein FNH07_23410 [Amycolatopsis bartoniae]GHF62319.1 hypothetical protein GCM10017566_39810 [Amycolatopsis bartoniae]